MELNVSCYHCFISNCVNQTLRVGSAVQVHFHSLKYPQ